MMILIGSIMTLGSMFGLFYCGIKELPFIPLYYVPLGILAVVGITIFNLGFTEE